MNDPLYDQRTEGDDAHVSAEELRAGRERHFARMKSVKPVMPPLPYRRGTVMIRRKKKHHPAQDDLSLDEDERTILRNRLIRHMEHTPADVAHPSASSSSARSGRSSLLMLLHVMLPRAMLAAVLLCAAGGGVIAASFQSMPGDVLYPVKVDLAEPMMGLFIIDAVAQAEHEADLAQRRLAEAEHLRAAEPVAAAVRDEVRDRFIRHLSTARSRIQAVHSAGHADRAHALVRHMSGMLATQKDMLQFIGFQEESASSEAERRLLRMLRRKEEREERLPTGAKSSSFSSSFSSSVRSSVQSSVGIGSSSSAADATPPPSDVRLPVTDRLPVIPEDLSPVLPPAVRALLSPRMREGQADDPLRGHPEE